MIRFGTGGFRGVIGEDFDKANVQLIAQGLAEVSRRRKTINPWPWDMIIVLFPIVRRFG